jgi:predicted dehydrogenase
MKFALLGLDDATLELARAIVADEGHELAILCQYEAAQPQLVESIRAIARSARAIGDWAALCEPGAVDAVIVARASDDEQRADALRRLVQQRVPVLATHPVVDSMLVYYELDMIRRETACPMMPYLPGRWHPAAQRVSQWLLAGETPELGRIEQLSFERRLHDRSKRAVLDQFARDVDLVRSLCGEVNRIGAMGPNDSDAAYANLAVQLDGPLGLPVRWSVAPLEDRPEGRIDVIGSQGRAIFRMPNDGDWELQLPGAAAPINANGWSPAAEAIQRLTRAIDGTDTAPNWIDAARSIELAESVERSLRKGRTLELHFEDYTEEGTFKGTMTSLGCGLLVGGLVLIVIVAVLNSLGFPILSNWPLLLLGLMGLFLLMQLITLSFGDKEEPGFGKKGKRDAADQQKG